MKYECVIGPGYQLYPIDLLGQLDDPKHVPLGLLPPRRRSHFFAHILNGPAAQQMPSMRMNWEFREFTSLR
jgi:hypothetical protein